MEITAWYIRTVKEAVRVKSSAADEEIRGLIQACIAEMRIAGVYVADLEDAMVKQAVILYCKGYYGYDDKPEGFREAFGALRDAMALSGEYREPEGEA